MRNLLWAGVVLAIMANLAGCAPSYEALILEKKYPEAVAAAQAEARRSNAVYSYLRLANAELLAGLFNDAVADYRQTLARASDVSDGSWRGYAYGGLIAAKLLAGRTDEAIQAADEGMAVQNPTGLIFQGSLGLWKPGQQPYWLDADGDLHPYAVYEYALSLKQQAGDTKGVADITELLALSKAAFPAYSRCQQLNNSRPCENRVLHALADAIRQAGLVQFSGLADNMVALGDYNEERAAQLAATSADSDDGSAELVGALLGVVNAARTPARTPRIEPTMPQSTGGSDVCFRDRSGVWACR